MRRKAAIKVLLVDHHVAVRAGCACVLRQAAGIAVAAETDNAEDAYRLASTQDIDVVLLALSLPGISGFEACTRITRRRTDVRVLVLSTHEEPLFVRRAMAAGARGYLTKTAPASALADAVRAVAAGTHYLDSRLCSDDAAPVPLEQLSPREFEIFRLLADGHDIGKVAQVLFISVKTVANNASRLRAKLGVVSPAELTRLALHYGVIKV
ncbi:MAG: response regulator transcription factor [Salinisphaera sp.]|nr:response regulator transcription factor [Salinisphaera sp.]